MATRPVDDLRELERVDSELRARADRLLTLDRETAALRAAAETIGAFFAAYPEEDSRLRSAAAEARADLERRREERALAERELAAAGDDDARAVAERALTRSTDHVAAAEARAARAQEAHDALEREATALPQELGALEEQARRLAAELADVPAPGDGPAGLVDWASRAHAWIFVSAGSVDTQRDRVIREANELASMLLGEPTYGSTVEQVTRRVESALG